MPFLASAPAQAQATRTWVSGVGDDANPCSRTAPCKTFAGAISKTAAAGEINCLDPGGFGGVTITKSITIDCSEIAASVLVSGTNGININAGAADRIILRNIRVQGVNAGLVGIKIFAAAVVSIENCVVSQFSQQGISDARTAGNTKLFVRNTVVSHNASTGIGLGGANPNRVVVENSHLVNNLFGIAAATGNNAMVTRSVMSGNTTGAEADPGGSINIDSSAITGNGTGVQTTSTIRLSNSDLSFNTTGISGTVISFGNNRMLGNTSLGGTVTGAGGAVSNLGEQ
ncbi:hypothetical protein C2U70_12990 [Bradyrhizobium guangdongense]|nr:hypothetical protein C2U70_12990 [Bradyrhizobium guangdongense]